jgi:hypothetical protein
MSEINDTQKDVLLLSFIGCLKNKGSWCGETHIQKGTYFYQELMGVPLGFEFILYKHGPFSFDLKDKLTALRADLLLNVTSRPPYGPSIVLGENSEAVLERFPKTRACFREREEFLASRLASKKVDELERLGTAFLVLREKLPQGSVDERALKIHELKPHVSVDLAREAVLEVDKLIEDVKPHMTSNS